MVYVPCVTCRDSGVFPIGAGWASCLCAVGRWRCRTGMDEALELHFDVEDGSVARQLLELDAEIELADTIKVRRLRTPQAKNRFRYGFALGKVDVEAAAGAGDDSHAGKSDR